MERKKTPEQLRSHRWFGAEDLRAFGHRSRMLQMGYSIDDFKGKPIVAIINTWSDINPCHAHFKNRVEDVKRGILQAGGFPVELPAISLAETYVKPTTMFYRNLLAMEAEELLRSHPVDGAVLMGGCDKTTPALLMGAISMNLPAILMPAGPMLRGNWGGKTLGSGSDVWKYWAEKEAGNISQAQWEEMEAGIARSYGHCMTMGTASTLTSLAETLGFTLPNASSIPAPDSGHPRMAANTGKQIVEMIWQDRKPSDVLTRGSFENALTVQMALGGSTNAIPHLIAMSKRAGLDIGLKDFEAASRRMGVIANLRPSGEFLMEDFFYAGGLTGLLENIRSHLDTDCMTVNGKTLGDNIAGAPIYNADVIRGVENAIYSAGATAVLYGNIAPRGCVMKPSAADPRLLKHTGPALVFRDYNDMNAQINRDDLDVTADHILVLQNAGPVGGPGMPEWGMLPIPKKLLKQGVRDMLRISDARMSGTSYGACILHVAPESYIGGPLAAVQTGDMISVDIENRSIHVALGDDEIQSRLAIWNPPNRDYGRGYGRMYANHITQADEGCDFDFLTGTTPIEDPEIH
ncbi:L-arabinonate dehydratase [Thalassospira mesophila]|uniref:Dihydroxy-acid dehydratase n=1 Tax=Thalassospira mesophila TaxID=1293891 RepID=A0A1Y2KZ14_9PROT|nr:L-arabinonate dehydratase [Thalassospira mesophila]OSQ37438.1 dihydroxy-acid dehydratase [Thalassospira mesophila]